MPLTLNGDSGITYANLNSQVTTLLQPKNWIINGQFEIWQRGTSQTTSGYGSDDRFSNEHNGSTKTHSQQAFTVGQTVVPNNPKYFSRTVVSSVTGASNFVTKVQKIEDVLKLAGKSVTLSFWAKADSNKNMAIEFLQYFGAGGSAFVTALGVQKFALTTSWQRFTKTVLIPSASGKTIGVDNSLMVQVWFDAGSNSNANTDSLGHQSGTFDIANVSLVEGSVAVECQNQPYDEVLEQCLRYYVRYDSTSQYVRFCMGTANGTTQCVLLMPLFKKMRTPNPAIEAVNLQLFDGVNATNVVSSIGYADAISLSHAYMVAVTTGLTQYRTYYLLTINSSGYLAFSSEL